MKRLLLFVVAGVMMSASVAMAGTTRSFWTSVSSANLVTAINAVNYNTGGADENITMTATFYSNAGSALGSTTRVVTPNQRWNFSSTSTGNSTLDANIISNTTGSVRFTGSGSAFGAYATVYVTTSISGFNFTLSE